MARRPLQTEQSTPRFRLETLERRILFSADAALISPDLFPEPASSLVAMRQVQSTEIRTEESIQESSAQVRELVVVDSTLPNLEKVLQELRLTDSERTEVVVLNEQEDALDQISTLLRHHSGLTAFHVVSRANNGTLVFGEQRIETMDLLSHAEELTAWRKALAPQADLLIHGFESANDGVARQFTDTLSRLTGASVNASNDKVLMRSGGFDSAINSATTRLGGVNEAPVFSTSTFAGSTAPTLPTFTPHQIDTTLNAPTTVETADIDSDGDLDVIATYAFDDLVVWYENDGVGNFVSHIINPNANGARSAVAADVDGDGDMDVLSASNNDNRLIWYENDGNENFTTHIISSAFDAFDVKTADIDGDGDLDVLSANRTNDSVIWFENDGNQNFTANVITSSANGVHNEQRQ